MQMKIDDIGRVTHDVGGDADIGTIEMKARQIVGEPDARSATDDKEIFVQRLHSFRILPNLIVGAVTIRNPQRQLAWRHAAGVTSHGPVRIVARQLLQPFIQHLAPVREQENILVAKDDVIPPCLVEQLIETLIGTNGVAFGVVDVDEFAIVCAEPALFEGLQEGVVLIAVSYQCRDGVANIGIRNS